MTCPHCQSGPLAYQNPLLYRCLKCGGWASLTGAVSIEQPRPAARDVTAADLRRFDERRKRP